MAEKIKLVRGDTRPQLQLTLTDETTGEAINLVGATVRLRFRAAGTTTVLSNFTGAVNDATAGKAVFVWPQGSLDVEPGDYEGEVEVTFSDSTVQTVYDVLKFKLRDQF